MDTTTDGQQPEHVRADEPARVIDELADDMVHVLGGLRKLDAAHTLMNERIAAIEQAAAEHHRQIARQIETVRRDAFADRKWTAHTTVLSALAPLADQIDLMRVGLDPTQDDRTLAQLDGLASAIAAVLLGLGFESFRVSPGDSFDADRMACVGHLPGEPGIVVRAERGGYRVGDVVLRPAAVLLGQ